MGILEDIARNREGTPMGLFSRKTPAQQLEAADAKARAKATKRGIDMTGAALVLHERDQDGVPCTLVLREAWLEFHNHGTGIARQVPLSQVLAVDVRSGIFGEALTIEANGETLDFFIRDAPAAPARDVILGKVRT